MLTLVFLRSQAMVKEQFALLRRLNTHPYTSESRKLCRNFAIPNSVISHEWILFQLLSPANFPLLGLSFPRCLRGHAYFIHFRFHFLGTVSQLPFMIQVKKNLFSNQYSIVTDNSGLFGYPRIELFSVFGILLWSNSFRTVFEFLNWICFDGIFQFPSFDSKSPLPFIRLRNRKHSETSWKSYRKG